MDAKKILLGCFLLTSVISIAQNKSVEVSCEPQAVTVYNASAELHFTQEVKLPAGKSTIIFTGLTPYIVENTINMSTSSKETELIMVTERINFTKVKTQDSKRISALQDSIKKTERELGLSKCKSDALNRQRDLLFKNESIGGISQGVSVAQIEAAADFYNKRYYDLSVQLYDLEERESKLSNYVDNCKRQIGQLSTNITTTCSEIEVTVNQPSAATVKFEFKFLTDKAGWAPMYDIKFQGFGEPIKFNFKANVFNATGNNWENIGIKLSTASPTEGFNAPTIDGTPKANRSQSANPNVKFIEVIVANSVAEYDIKHKYSIPSDSKPYLVDVTSMDLKADFYYMLIPKVDPFGFLMAKIPDWNKYNLIPGVTNVYNKGSYMGKTFLNTYAENDTLNVYLGKDNSIQSNRKEKESERNNKIIGNFYIEKSTTTISIKNSSGFRVPVKMLDQVPVYDIEDDEKMTLSGVEQATYVKSEGLLTWNFELGAGETKEIEFGYEIKIPKNNIGNFRPPMKKFRTIACPSF